ncbi:MAG: efflux RND transporter periplasmic adaptor subunit, partial [Rhodocyclaceae bacterium]
PITPLRAPHLLLCSLLLATAPGLEAQAVPPPPPAASAPLAAPEPSVPVVSLVRPRTAMWPERVEVQGDVMPWQEIRINAEIGGLRLTSLQVSVGDFVRKGQVLALLDTASVEAETDNLNAQVVEADAAQAQADATLARAKRLVASGGVSQQELAQYETQKQTAIARLAAARARLKAQQLKADAARLLAPDDGLISASSVGEGDIVRAGAELFRLIRQGRLEWRAEVPGETLLRLEPGQEIIISSPLGDDVKGRVRRLSPTIDLSTRTGLAYVDLPTEARFKAGLRVSGKLTTQRKALVVPASAVQHSDNGQRVFTLDAANKLRAIKVETGRSQGDDVEITSELDARLRVVASGVEALKAGLAVREAAPAEARTPDVANRARP